MLISDNIFKNRRDRRDPPISKQLPNLPRRRQIRVNSSKHHARCTFRKNEGACNEEDRETPMTRVNVTTDEPERCGATSSNFSQRELRERVQGSARSDRTRSRKMDRRDRRNAGGGIFAIPMPSSTSSLAFSPPPPHRFVHVHPFAFGRLRRQHGRLSRDCRRRSSLRNAR